MKTKLLLLLVVITVTTISAQSDQDIQSKQLITEDLFVQGSLGIGLNIVNNQAFGSDTFIMKEDNLRMFFDDNSSSGSFPSNDWRFTFNSNENGGDNYFSIDDATAGTVPFRIDAGAGNNAMRIESGGNVGIGIADPVVELHVNDGDTPTVRIQQDGSNGFTPQIWDLAGNETNFFIRDVTNGSKLPFKIQPNSPTNALTVRASGTVGIGTFGPNTNASLHMTSTTQGLLINRMTTAQRTTFAASLGTGENGMMVFDNEENKLYVWDSTQWVTNTDDQALSLSTNTLTLEDGGTVDLAPYLDNTDNQELSLATNTLSISGGTNTIDLSSYVNTDNQELTSATLSNNQLTIAIENGNSVQVDLSSIISPLETENLAQQAQIDDLITRMEALEDCACQPLNVDENGDPDAKADKAILYQNIPNPFNGTSSIKYFVPQKADRAAIVFSNNSGQIMSNVKLEKLGDGELNINSDGLSSGIYYYTLYVNGQKATSTRKMVIE
ncbi:T9SS type A sorting domain-containing protein [Aquimarina sp. MMG016]|uniref:T9SS type A sorting domain-containing protein n=1 Tax=Aquimarina sp. MMG016 TaxID=2822690 RepID=UPI001B3A40FC|nr:T9SS type A sorting domain-containing protein [Aquimarina sp. MMG016]MBQ4820668.1 T9SS type A sorting domain-containing protein [Aquimarina sp. MMG016]